MHVSTNVEAPAVDGRDPATLIPAAIDEILETVATWVAWDETPHYGDGNAWTPHKSLRRVCDHLLDHLAEINCILVGAQTVPDGWHGRNMTFDADYARFSEADFDEARNRLLRYAQLYRLLLGSLDADELDRPRQASWTIRQIAHHVANVTYYARQLGVLAE